MSRIYKSPTHAEELVKKVSTLLVGRRRYSDIQIEVGGKVFHCHKLILALQSKYFDARLYPKNTTDVVGKIVVEDICRDDFQHFLSFIYRGEIELHYQNIESVVRAAVVLCVSELKKVCAQYIVETLYVRNCLRYWNLAEQIGIKEAIDACRALFLEDFTKVVQASDLGDMTESMMQEALASHSLQIAREEDICAVLVKWIDAQAKRKKPSMSCELLRHVRWSGVSPEYIKSKLLTNVNIIGSCQCVKFLSNVLTYRHTGVQFEGLRTFHRASTGIEQSVVLVGLNTGDKISSEMYRVSLQTPCMFIKLQDVPSKMEMESVACVSSNVLFVTGIGPKRRSVYRWDPLSGWGRCGDLIEGRRRHCATFVSNAALYVFGGYFDDSDSILSSVEQYNPVTNKWLRAGELAHPTECAACISYKTIAYLFGGSSRQTDVDIDLDCVQMFDTATKTCCVLCRQMPQPERLLRAVLWENSVILLNCRTCIIFDLDQQTFQQRDAQYAAGVSHFGLVLENQTIYILGGRIAASHCSNCDKDQAKDGKEAKEGRCPKEQKSGKEGKPSQKDSKTPCCDEVRTMSVCDLIGNSPTGCWLLHAKLPMPCLVQACAVLTLPLCPAPDAEKGKKKDKEDKCELDKGAKGKN